LSLIIQAEEGRLRSRQEERGGFGRGDGRGGGGEELAVSGRGLKRDNEGREVKDNASLVSEEGRAPASLSTTRKREGRCRLKKRSDAPGKERHLGPPRSLFRKKKKKGPSTCKGRKERRLLRERREGRRSKGKASRGRETT